MPTTLLPGGLVSQHPLLGDEPWKTQNQTFCILHRATAAILRVSQVPCALLYLVLFRSRATLAFEADRSRPVFPLKIHVVPFEYLK